LEDLLAQQNEDQEKTGDSAKIYNKFQYNQTLN